MPSRPPARTGAAASRYRTAADFLVADEGRQAVEHDASIDLRRACAWRAVRREQIALARRLQARALEQVDVLIDRPADKDHDLIVEHIERPGALLLQRRVVLDQALRDRHGLDRAFFHAGAQLR